MKCDFACFKGYFSSRKDAWKATEPNELTINKENPFDRNRRLAPVVRLTIEWYYNC
jgi:hypothetical protein